MPSLTQSPTENYQPPSYKTPGRVLLRLYKEDTSEFGYGFEVYDWDSDACPFWINEGTGFDWWLEGWFEIDLVEADGWFVIEDITGDCGTSIDYWSGANEGWEEFYAGNVRRASEDEIRTEILNDIPSSTPKQ